jgi:very-short-patch-repair endonuclease
MLDVMPPVTYGQLIGSGWTRHEIRIRVARGSLRRIARGWYDLGTSSADEHTAAASGTRIGCLTGLRDHGVWVPPTTHPHVIAPRWVNTSTRAAVKHELPRGHSWPRRTIVFGLVDCLRQVLRHHDVETSLIVLESVINLRMVPQSVVVGLTRECPPRRAGQLRARLDPKAESGTETRVRLFLARRGYRVRSQVVIPRVGRVDLLVGESLIIECDSHAHHTGESAYWSDRTRDLRAAALGYRVIRLTWEQVFLDWEVTQALLVEHLRGRAYRRPASAYG